MSANVIAKLEKQLRDFWTDPTPGALPKSRVCTMNLEVVAGSRALLERYMPVVEEVTTSTPARAIMAAVLPHEPGDELTGEASAICSAESGKNVCVERIVLIARGNAAARAASAIEAFLVPEIPTVLVWLGRVHVDDPVFEDLANDANRIVLDSEHASLASMLHVAAWARKQPNAPLVADLAWTRIAIWQEMLARFFDEQSARQLAHHVVRVVVHQASEPKARLGPEAALLLGWLATRLSWKVSRLGGTLRLKRPDGVAVAIELGAVARPEGVAPNALASVTIEAEHDGQSLKGTIQRALGSGGGEDGSTKDADSVAWTLSRDGEAKLAQQIRLANNKAARWLEETLHRPASDAAFTESVILAEQIVEDGLTVGEGEP